MSVAAITSNTAVGTPSPTELAALNAATRATGGQSNLSENDFLKLLTTQLQNQDPLQPMTDTEFIAQMATFSQLSATNTLNTNFSSYSAEQAITGAQNFIGKTVTVTGAAEGIPETSGVVTGVTVSNGEPQLTVGGVNYSVSDVTAISPTNTTTSAGTGTGTNAGNSGTTAATNSSTAQTTATTN